MTEPKDLTDAELVEAVAREVMDARVAKLYDKEGDILCIFNDGTNSYHTHFFSDMNDLFMVLEKFGTRIMLYDEETKRHTVMISKKLNAVSINSLLPRAVLEAALMAERGKE